MTEHFTRNTVSAAFWCSKCQKFTQHRIDDHRKGPCLECIARLEKLHAVIDFDEIQCGQKDRDAKILAESNIELLEALKALEEQVADFRAGRTWDADYIGLKAAHLKAKVAIQKAELRRKLNREPEQKELFA
jgi:hypothetical protein